MEAKGEPYYILWLPTYDFYHRINVIGSVIDFPHDFFEQVICLFFADTLVFSQNILLELLDQPCTQR